MQAFQRIKWISSVMTSMPHTRKNFNRRPDAEDGVTTKEMSEAYKLSTRKTLNSDAIRKSFLYELMNNGYVEQEDSVLDKRKKIYRPLIEPELEPEKIKKLRESDPLPQFITTFSDHTT